MGGSILRYKNTVDLLENFPQETISSYCQYVDKKFYMDNMFHLSNMVLNTDMKDFFNTNSKLLTSKKGKLAVESFVKLYKLNLNQQLIIEIIRLKTKDQTSFISKTLGMFTMKAINSNPQVLAYDKNDGVSIKRAAITNWIIENILGRKEFNPHTLIDNYNNMLISIGNSKETQHKMMMNINELVNIKRIKRRDGDILLDIYVVNGLYIPESILRDSNLSITDDNLKSLETASENWLLKKMEAVDKMLTKSQMFQSFDNVSNIYNKTLEQERVLGHDLRKSA